MSNISTYDSDLFIREQEVLSYLRRDWQVAITCVWFPLLLFAKTIQEYYLLLLVMLVKVTEIYEIVAYRNYIYAIIPATKALFYRIYYSS